MGTPVRVARSLALREIDLGNRHTCGLAHDGAVWCWGSNGFNELDGTFRPDSASPIEVGGIPAPADAIASGGFSNCALLTDGTIACWGAWHQEAGLITPVRISGAEAAVAVDRDAGTACAVLADGGVVCWGLNEWGQLGDGTVGGELSRDGARPVVGLPNRAIGLGIGGDFSCAVLASGGGACWGRGEDGTLGDGTFTNKPTPSLLKDLTGVIDIAASISHACALLLDGGVACWGDNVFVLDDIDYVATPTRVEGIANAIDIAVGAWYTCVLTADQEIHCWGENGSHQLGLGDGSPFFVETPTRVEWRNALP